MSRKSKFYYNLTRIRGNLHEVVFTFMIISRWTILKTKSVLDKYCKENQADILCSIRRVRFACWLTKTTHTHSLSLRICDTFCFSVVKIFSRTGLNFALYVHCPSCFNILSHLHWSLQSWYLKKWQGWNQAALKKINKKVTPITCNVLKQILWEENMDKIKYFSQ
jgi:hypothetical protein